MSLMEANLIEHERREESELAELIRKIDSMKDEIAEVSEILKAWNNAKGFVQTIQAVAKVVSVVAIFVSPFVAFGYFIKTGNWK